MKVKRNLKILENHMHDYELNITKDVFEYVSPSSIKILGYTSEEMMSFT